MWLPIKLRSPRLLGEESNSGHVLGMNPSLAGKHGQNWREHPRKEKAGKQEEQSDGRMEYRQQEKQGDCLQAKPGRREKGSEPREGEGGRNAALRILARGVQAQFREMYRVSGEQAWTLRHRRANEFIETYLQECG